MRIVSDVHISTGVHEGMLLPLSHFLSHQNSMCLVCLLEAVPGFPRPLWEEPLGYCWYWKSTNNTNLTLPRKHVGMGSTECLKTCAAFPRRCPPPALQSRCTVLLHSLSANSWERPGRKRCEIGRGTKDPSAAPEADSKSFAVFSKAEAVKNRSVLKSLWCVHLLWNSLGFQCVCTCTVRGDAQFFGNWKFNQKATFPACYLWAQPPEGHPSDISCCF